MSGVHGRLGDLGSINQKYDIAVSNSCPALDCIIVETLKEAEKCLNHLRENNIGRTAIIALDKMIKIQP